ncbi:MAG TPA: EAL domain-containing protein [Acidimicrobiales bacterium]|nr:EAL domain-containing protein [Acidimicrobiales bacterium]
MVRTAERNRFPLASSFDLLQAVECDQLVLHYQPIIDLRTGGTVSLEALVRWCHPDQGLLPPDRFLPMAENSWLGGALTAWVLERAVSDCAAWRWAGFAAGVSVNVLPEAITQTWLADTVDHLLGLHGLPGEALTIEITERRWPEDLFNVQQTMDALARLGVATSLDDFGTGDSSLARLQHLRFTEIKIDKSFVCEASERNESREILRYTADLARALGTRSVAEGVELAPDLELVRTMEIDAVQGYLLARPRPLEELSVGLST